MRFEGRVVIVTGAGSNPGLGRSYARLLAAQGARVVVNDLGIGPDGSGAVPSSAVAVADEIHAAGGVAVADTNSVASEAGAAAIARTALDAFGRIDALVNNAGVVAFAPFGDIPPAAIERVLQTHVFGTIWMCRAVWPHMQNAGYGRIVNTASHALLGARHTSIYGAAKGAVLGLTRNLAIEGADHGIRVNAFAPMAATVAWWRMSDAAAQPTAEVAREMSPDRVAPVAALLADEACPVSGEMIGAAGDEVHEVFHSRTSGARSNAWTVEALVDRWSEVVARGGAREFGSPSDGGAGFTVSPPASSTS